jgi:hypothetical protein
VVVVVVAHCGNVKVLIGVCLPFISFPSSAVFPLHSEAKQSKETTEEKNWGAIHQLLSIILKLKILVLLPVSTMPYVVIINNYS